MLDIRYMDEVVRLAQKNDSNALAEIYAATCKKQYALALGWLGDEFRAQDALQDCYTAVFTGISRIQDGQMSVVYVTKCCISACLEISCEESHSEPSGLKVTIDSSEFTVGQLEHLRMSEYVCLLLRYLCRMSVLQIASLLEIRPITVRRYIAAGREALNGKV